MTPNSIINWEYLGKTFENTASSTKLYLHFSSYKLPNRAMRLADSLNIAQINHKQSNGVW